MTKILVADEEKDLEVLIRQKFRQKIRQEQSDFVFAINGNDALEKMNQHPDLQTRPLGKTIQQMVLLNAQLNHILSHKRNVTNYC